MNKRILFSFLTFALSACGGQEKAARWASGAPASLEQPEVEVLAPISADVSIEESPISNLVGNPAPTYFAVNRKPTSLPHGNAVTWLGCENQALVRGGYLSDANCGTALFHTRFEKQLNSQFFICSERAASKANISRPERIFINHVGAYNNRNGRGSKNLSMHAYARALDISKFNLIDGAGRLTQISTHIRDFKGKTKIFYNEFRACWKEAMPSKCKPGDREYKGSIGIPGSDLGGNKLHNDHIHLSFAQCGG
jgi:hypothetical protein